MKGFLIEAWSYKENKQVCWGTTRLAKAGSLQQRGDLPSAFLVNQIIKNPPAMCETQVQPLGGKHPWRREWLSTPVFMPGESHGQLRRRETSLSNSNHGALPIRFYCCWNSRQTARGSADRWVSKEEPPPKCLSQGCLCPGKISEGFIQHSYRWLLSA